jgi:hypothetical protein
VSDAYLREWASQLAFRFPELGVLADVATMRTSELVELIAFLEGYRARTEAMVA